MAVCGLPSVSGCDDLKGLVVQAVSRVRFTEPSLLAAEALKSFPPALARRARAKWLKTANRRSEHFHGIYDHCESEATAEVLAVAAAVRKKWTLPLDSSAGDDEIAADAEKTSRFASGWWNKAETRLLHDRWMAEIRLGGAEKWAEYAAAARLDNVRVLAGKCAARGVDASDLLEKLEKGKGITVDGLVKRLSDAAWCRMRLRRVFVRMREGVLRNDVGEVGAFKGLYVSDDLLNTRRGQRRRHEGVLEAVVMINELGQSFKLGELAAKSNANPAIRRAELMVRIAGFEQIAKDVGHVGEFITLTCPSAYHARHYKSGRRNDKFNDTTPREAAAYLNCVWARIRAALKDEDIKIYGFRVAEPHHDGTPHWHGLFFMERRHVLRFRQIVALHGCRQDKEELGLRYFLSKAQMRVHAKEIQAAEKLRAADGGGKARSVAKILDGFTVATEAEFWANADFWRIRKASPRVEFTHINWKRGSAAGYIAKYIAKNIDGKDANGDSVGVDLEALDGRSVAETAERVDAWASGWGVRQFQQIGGAPVSVWRELRRLDAASLDEGSDLMRAAVAADAGDWAKFCVVMGGIKAGRADMPVALYKEDLKMLNKYGEPGAPSVRGVIETQTGLFKISRVHEWTAVRNGGNAAAWTCVNNCRKQKFFGDEAPNLKTLPVIGTLTANEDFYVREWLIIRRQDGDDTIPADLDELTPEQFAQYRREWRNLTAESRDAVWKKSAAEAEAELDAAKAASLVQREKSERLRASRADVVRLRRLTAPSNWGIAAVRKPDEIPGKRSIKPSRAYAPKAHDTPVTAAARLRAAREAARAWMEADEDFLMV